MRKKIGISKHKILSAVSVMLTFAVLLMCFEPSLSAKANDLWTGTWDQSSPLITGVQLFDLTKESQQAAGSTVTAEMTLVNDVTKQDGTTIPAGTVYQAGDVLPALLSSTADYILAPVITDVSTGIGKSGNVRVLYTFAIPDEYTVSSATTYQFTLPKEVALQSAVTNMPLSAPGIDGAVATVSIPANPAGASTGTITFTAASNGYTDRHGAFYVDTQFSNMNNENTTPVEIPFAVQGVANPFTVSINFQQPAPSLAKTGSFDSPGSNINWTVTVNGNQTTVDNGYITDAVPAGLSYVPGTFTVTDNTTNTQVYKDASDPSTDAGQNIDDGDFTYTQSSATLRYNLPASTSDQYTVTYASSVPSGEYGKNLTNTANLYYNGKTTPVSAGATVTPSPNYITKSGAAKVVGGQQQITWTIPFNNDGGTLHDVNITDPYINGGTAAPTGSSLVTGSVKYYPTGSPDSAVVIGTSSSSTPYYEDAGGVLTVHFGDVTGAQTLVFTVQFPEDYLQVNQGSSFTNKAKLYASDNAYLAGGVPASNASGVGAGNSMLSKSGTPVYAAGQINWTVAVNASGRSMANAQLQDLIGANHTYVPGTFTVTDNTTNTQVYKDASTVAEQNITDGNFIYTQAAATLQYTFPPNTSDQYTVTYATKLNSTQNATYAGNTGASYGNTATLITDTSYPSVYSQVSPTVTYATTVLSKAGAGFDYSAHELSWKINVNAAQYPLTNVIVTDSLTDNSMKWHNGQTGDGSPTYAFDFDAAQPVQLKVGNNAPVTLTADATANPGAGKYYYDSTTRQLTFNLGDLNSVTLADRTQYITFKMKLVEPVDSYFMLNSNPVIGNTASVTSNENGSPTTATGTQVIHNTVVGKTAVYTANNKYIDWNVQIDQNSADIGSSVKLADPLQPGLLLDTSSVKLYPQAQNASDGTLTPSGSRNADGSLKNASTPISLSTAQVVYDVSTNEFSFTMPTSLGNISAPYLLTFRTYIDTSVITNNTTVNNIVTLSGQTVQTQNSGNASTTYKQNAGGYATGVTGQVTLKKTDAGLGQALTGGAKFSLYDQYGNHLRDVTTGSDGTVILPYLAFSVPYRLVETSAPAGYQNNNANDYWFEYINDGSGNGHVQQITSATDTTPIGNSTASSSSPTLIFSDAMKTAAVQFTKLGDGGTGLAGAQFTLTGTALNGSTVHLTSGTTDTSGQVTFSGVPYSNAGGYTITETVMPTDYFPIAPITGVVLDDSTVSGGVYTALAGSSKTDAPAGTLTVIKTDADTGARLPGVTFTLTKQNDPGSVYQPTTASDGLYVFSGIPLGTYVLTETAAPADYELAIGAQGNGQTVTFASGDLSQRVLVTFVEDSKSVGSVTFSKTDGTNPLAGAQFGLFYDQAGTNPVKVVGNSSETVVSNVTTTGNTNAGDDGKVAFSNVPYGDNYWVVETKTPVNHKMAAPFQVSLHQPSLTVSSANNPVVNTIKSGTIQFTKTDGYANLSGAQFTLSGNGIQPQTVTSGSNGLVKFINVPYSNIPYTITENSSPDAAVYQLAQPFTVTLDDAVEGAPNSASPAFSHSSFTPASGSDPNILTIDDVVDTPVGSITVTKVDAGNTGITLANAEFSVYDAYNGTYYTVGTATDMNGDLTFRNLLLDPNPNHPTVFTVTETTSPENYELDPVPITVTLYNRTGMRDSAADNLFGDSKKVATIRLHKQDQAGNPLHGAEFTLYETINGTVQVVSAPGLTNPVRSDNNCFVQFTDVPYGNYYIQETASPADYIGDAAKITVSLNDQNEKTASNTTGKIINGSSPAHLLDVGTVINTVRKGTIQFIKSGENGPLGGAVFTLCSADGTSVVKDGSGHPFTATSADGTGLVKFTDIPYGDYTVVETGAPADYTTAAPVRVSLHDSTVDTSGVLNVNDITDALQRSTITVHDTDQDGNPVPGDILQLINDDGVPLGATETTDANGNATFGDVPNGNYWVKNLSSGGIAPVSVILDGKSPLVSVTMLTPVRNPKTGDSQIPPYMAMYALVASGSAVIVLKKRKSGGRRQTQQGK